MSTEQILWHRRWQALDHNIATLLDRYESFMREDSTRRENTIFEVLLQLQKFAAGQFRFFHDGFYTKTFVDLAAIPDDRDFAFPQFITGHSIERHVLHNTLQQIAEDALVIQRASEQRLLSIMGATIGLAGGEQISLTLAGVDKLAFIALRMVGYYLANKQQTALTYFRRSASVRVIPYAPVAMIGIPITSLGLNSGMGVAEDLLAIPHEVAHHLYWNGQLPDGSRIRTAILARMKENPASHWVEEIFADVVGCLIGGPAVARSFLDLQLTAIAADFVHIQDPHPTPALRPLIYAYALEKMGFTKNAAAVRSVWQTHLNERMTFVNRELLFAAFQIVDHVLDVIDQEQLLAELRWSNDDVAYDTLYDYFAERIPDLVGDVTDADLDPEDLKIQTTWLDLATELSARPELHHLPAGWVAPEKVSAATNFTAIPMAAAEWLRIYNFGGWITAGPGGGNVSSD